MRAAADGQVAAAAFALFDTGARPADVVVALELNSFEATELYEQWVSLRGGMFLDAETVAQLEAFAHNYGAPLKNGADLAAIEGLDISNSAACDRRTPRICMGCYEQRSQRAEELLAHARTQHQERTEEFARLRNQRAAARTAHQSFAGRMDLGGGRPFVSPAPSGSRYSRDTTRSCSGGAAIPQAVTAMVEASPRMNS